MTLRGKVTGYSTSPDALLRLGQISVLVIGQLVTSRTAVVEEYLRGRVATLAVVGVSGVFSPENVSRCTFYETGEVIREFGMPGIRARSWTLREQPMVLLSFVTQVIGVMYSVIRFKRRYDLCVGVAFLSAFLGVVLKKLGLVKHVIYYSIDYYPRPEKSPIRRILVSLFCMGDRWCARNAPAVWDLARCIPEAREKIGKLSAGQYRHFRVPLGYPRRLVRLRSLTEIERYAIGFIGVLSPSVITKKIRSFEDLRYTLKVFRNYVQMIIASIKARGFKTIRPLQAEKYHGQRLKEQRLS